MTGHLGLDPGAADHDPLLGNEVGGVTLVRLISEGGMGRVYEGLQNKPRRPVAVKVMRPGFVSKEACRRFDLESEVLGRLRHPFIAHIHSAGICTVFGAQVPYFVMEFIPDALPITEFATRHRLTTDQRIDLFRKVCEAVAHGHEKGVVHRDLKPSNILVEPSGLPKVIDFGVARSIDAAPEQITALTDIGQLIGTVQYMSPEQFSSEPSQVDRRADVYALGVVLYELLTGKPPYEIRRKQIFEAAEVVRKQAPVPLSHLNRNVRPDVEKIAGTCLQKDRTRRYASAAELAHALTACLAGQPVSSPQAGDGGSVPATGRGWPRPITLATLGGVFLLSLILLVGRSHGPQVPQGRVPEASAPAAAAPALAIAPCDPAQAREHQEAWAQHPGIPVETTNSVGATLVVIPPGRFTMGEGDTARVVTLAKPFLIGRTEVTQGQWREVMGTEPWKGRQHTSEGADIVATYVSWDDAVAFCRRLTERERAGGSLRPEQQYRLVTDEEWEFACLAGSTTVYSFGDEGDRLGDYGWFGGGWKNGPVPGGNTAPEMHLRAVGLKRANAWGLCDVHGGVWEWVGPGDGASSTLPGDGRQEASERARCVGRGGAWCEPAWACRSAARRPDTSSVRHMHMGFRVARSF